MIFTSKRPFIPNEVLANKWRYGFTKIKKLKDVDNVGLYLTAYLSDMELGEALSSGGPIKVNRIKEVETSEGKTDKNCKAIVKGQRLKLYPSGFRLYRASQGIKRPEIIECTEAEAMQLVGDAPLTYEKTIHIVDENNGAGLNIINYRHYNKARKEETRDE